MYFIRGALGDRNVGRGARLSLLALTGGLIRGLDLGLTRDPALSRFSLSERSCI